MRPAQVVVVGAGPAGLMAAGQAAGMGAAVLLIEKMDRPGRKLSVTGHGRCNLTHAAPLPEFLERFGRHGDFLRSAFAGFFRDDLRAFLDELGVPTTVEPDGRVFPLRHRAPEIAARLTAWARTRGVIVRTRARVDSLVLEGDRVIGVEERTRAQIVPADAVVLATGGASYPHTGSSGDGYRLAAQAGHRIVPPRAAVVPLVTAGSVARRLQGLSLRAIDVGLLIGGRRRAAARGDLLFTHFGVSGPAVLALSARAVVALEKGATVALSLDLFPGLSAAQLDERLRGELAAHGRRKSATFLSTLLPPKLVAVCAEQNGIALEEPAHRTTAAARRRLCAWLKEFRLEIAAHRPLAEAMVTAGGVDLREIDPRTLASRRLRGLFVCGELLDIDADTGGFNLQAAFSTGWLAGRSAAAGQGRTT